MSTSSEKPERRRYFNSYFTDKEQARNALDIVYKEMMFSNKACQVPGVCCVVCSWRKGQIE